MTVRDDVRGWVALHWSPDLTIRAWWALLDGAGLSQPTWAEPFGRGCSVADARVVDEELAAVGAIAAPEGAVGVGLAAPTLFAHGTPEQQERFLRPLLRGEESWCQLFSEPGAGSDLPSLTTSARSDSGGWVVNGQKVWSSNAQLARRGMLLARTDPDAPGRSGISYFVLDMAQPGVVVRPIRQMNGIERFCEVFLDDVRVEAGDLVGELHDGWRVARTTLGNERANVARRPRRGLTAVASGELAGNLDRKAGDLIASAPTNAAFEGRAVPLRRLIELAREHDRHTDPHVRDGLARYAVLTGVNRAAQRRGVPPAVTKLLVTRICIESRELSYSILGAATMLDGGDAPHGGDLHVVGLGSVGVRIGGGTDEIQRNQLAERVLGLPA